VQVADTGGLERNESASVAREDMPVPGRWWGPGAKAIGFEPGQRIDREPYDLLFGQRKLRTSFVSMMSYQDAPARVRRWGAGSCGGPMSSADRSPPAHGIRLLEYAAPLQQQIGYPACGNRQPERRDPEQEHCGNRLVRGNPDGREPGC
jgi:hypothetical protein